MYNIFGLLSEHLPRPLAIALCALWYAVLFLGILALSFEPTAEFRYLNL